MMVSPPQSFTCGGAELVNMTLFMIIYLQHKCISTLKYRIEVRSGRKSIMY